MKRVLICLLVLALVGCSALAEVDVRIGTKLRVVNCDEYVTLRAEPDTKAAALDRIPLGCEAVSLIDQRNGFVRVAWKGQMGWVLEKYLKSIDESGTAIDLTEAHGSECSVLLTAGLRYSTIF